MLLNKTRIWKQGTQTTPFLTLLQLTVPAERSTLSLHSACTFFNQEGKQLYQRHPKRHLHQYPLSQKRRPLCKPLLKTRQPRARTQYLRHPPLKDKNYLELRKYPSSQKKNRMNTVPRISRQRTRLDVKRPTITPRQSLHSQTLEPTRVLTESRDATQTIVQRALRFQSSSTVPLKYPAVHRPI